MKPIAKFSLKIFVFTVCFFALTEYGLAYKEIEDSIWMILAKSIVFGIVLTLSLVTLHVIRLRKIGVDELTNENFKVKQRSKLITSMGIYEVVEELKRDQKLKKNKMVLSDHSVVFNTGMSWQSWGENITIEVRQLENGQYEYSLESKPSLSITLVDYGKNLQNIMKLERLIQTA